jgi:hypothetical protein
MTAEWLIALLGEGVMGEERGQPLLCNLCNTARTL